MIGNQQREFNHVALDMPMEVTAEDMAIEAPIPVCDKCAYFLIDCHCLYCHRCSKFEIYCPCGFYQGVKKYARKNLIFEDQGVGVY